MANRCVLQVTNITHTATDREISDLFSVAGEVARTTIIQTGFPYYAFVEYYQPDDARRALNLNGRFLGPSRINVSLSNQSFPQQNALLGAGPPAAAAVDLRRGNPYQQQQQQHHHRHNDGLPYKRASPPRTTWEEPVRRSPPRTVQEYPPPPRYSENSTRQSRFDDNSTRQSRFDDDNGRPYNDDRSHHRYNTDVQVAAPVLPATTNHEMTPVWLSSIPASVKEHNLHQIFSEFGTVCDTKMFKDHAELPTGRGKVIMHSLEAAADAASKMDGRQLDNTLMRLSCSLTDPFSRGGQETSHHGKMIEKTDLRAVLNSRVHPYNNNPEIQPKVPVMPSTIDVHGGASHSFTPNPAALGADPYPVGIYVGNLPETSCKQCLLYQLFSPYGAIASVKAMEPNINTKDNFTPGSWFGFVNYVTQDGAEMAVSTLHKSTLDGQVLKVTYKMSKWEKMRSTNNVMFGEVNL